MNRYEEIDLLQKTEIEELKFYSVTEKYFLFCCLAFICFLLELVLNYSVLKRETLQVMYDKITKDQLKHLEDIRILKKAKNNDIRILDNSKEINISILDIGEIK